MKKEAKADMPLCLSCTTGMLLFSLSQLLIKVFNMTFCAGSTATLILHTGQGAVSFVSKEG